MVDIMITNIQKYGVITFYSALILTCYLIYFLMATIAAQAFFRRKKTTKKLMIAYYAVNFITTACMAVLPAVLFNISLANNDISAIFSVTVGILAWTPYFLLSKRIPVVFHK